MPTRTWPPAAIASDVIGSCARPTPMADQLDPSGTPPARCSRFRGVAAMPPGMPITNWNHIGARSSPSSASRRQNSTCETSKHSSSGLHPVLQAGLGEGAQKRRRVEEHAVAEVQRTGVERAQIGPQRDHRQPVGLLHRPRAGRRQVDQQVGRGVAHGGDRLPVAAEVHRRPALRVAHVDVDHRRRRRPPTPRPRRRSRPARSGTCGVRSRVVSAPVGATVTTSGSLKAIAAAPRARPAARSACRARPRARDRVAQRVARPRRRW